MGGAGGRARRPKGPQSRNRARRAAREGGRARGARGARGSMSQQRPARRLPSLLVDPAQETVRRRCRDPINVESLLVSAGQDHRGSRAAGRALCVRPSAPLSLGCPGALPEAPHPRTALCFLHISIAFTYFVGGRAGAWIPRGNLGKSVLCFHLCGSQDGTQVEFVKLGGKCLPELSDLARPSVLFDRGNERAAIPSIFGFPRFSGPLLGPSFVHFSCSLFSLQDKQYPSGSGQSRASYFMSTVCSH